METLLARSQSHFPGGVNSPVRAFKGLGIDPLFIERGYGPYLYPHHHNPLIDLCMSWGSLFFGHADPETCRTVCDQMQRGSSYGVTSIIEVEFGEKIKAFFPSIEKLRLVSSGTEACMTAIRIARGATGREKIIKFDGHYHGHADPFLVKAGSGATAFGEDSFSLGVPKGSIENTISIPFQENEIFESTLNKYEGQIAAVIVEPVTANMGVIAPRKEFLELLRKRCSEKGIVLIFDEVVTGFRVDVGGAQKLYGITPDLTTLGKIIGGGFPLAAVGGRKDLMDFLAPIGRVYQAGTLSGNPIAVAAGLSVLKRMSADLVDELSQKTLYIVDAIREELKGIGTVQSCGSMFTIFFGPESVQSQTDLARCNQDLFIEYFQHMLSYGIYVSPMQCEGCFISTAHDEYHINQIIQAIREFLHTRVGALV